MDLAAIIATTASGLAVSIIGFVGKALQKKISLVIDEFSSLRNDVKNLQEAELQDLRADIHHTYKEVKQKGYIEPMELEIVCGKYAKYVEGGGNTFAGKLMEYILEAPIEGEPVPEH